MRAVPAFIVLSSTTSDKNTAVDETTAADDGDEQRGAISEIEHR
jgi:hypothetical protein